MIPEIIGKSTAALAVMRILPRFAGRSGRIIRVVLDGVFNHVERGFWAFQDVLQHREQSEYRDWFYIRFDGNSCYNDGLWYEGWEGHFELVKLNLDNPKVTEYLFSCIRSWIDEFQIDGLRLDVAYCLNESFLRKLRQFCDSVRQDFFLLGEILFGDYRRIVNAGMLHSCTNYECYKGLYSSFNDMNLFEISYSLSTANSGRMPMQSTGESICWPLRITMM